MRPFECQNIYDKLYDLGSRGIKDINFIKAKSHVTNEEEWIKYHMTPEMLIYNELADDAARIGAETRTSTITVKDDASAKYQALRIAERLAAIEVSTWTGDDHRAKSHIVVVVFNPRLGVLHPLHDVAEDTEGLLVL